MYVDVDVRFVKNTPIPSNSGSCDAIMNHEMLDSRFCCPIQNGLLHLVREVWANRHLS
jgi:hypothetical protein